MMNIYANLLANYSFAQLSNAIGKYIKQHNEYAISATRLSNECRVTLYLQFLNNDDGEIYDMNLDIFITGYSKSPKENVIRVNSLYTDRTISHNTYNCDKYDGMNEIYNAIWKKILAGLHKKYPEFSLLPKSEQI